MEKKFLISTNKFQGNRSSTSIGITNGTQSKETEEDKSVKNSASNANLLPSDKIKQQIRSGLIKCYEEKIEDVRIHNFERKRLDDVFERLCSQTKKTFDESRKDDEEYMNSIKCITAKDIAKILDTLNFKEFTREDIDNMIWEVDEDLDRAINKHEFDLMFKRCIADESNLEPKTLFYLVQFLMYDNGKKGLITSEDTLELINIRLVEKGIPEVTRMSRMEDEIRVIFGEEETKDDGSEVQIDFSTFLKRRIKKDLEDRENMIKEKQKAKSTLKTKEK